MAAIRVLVIDDSALVRQLLREMLQSDPDIEVVGHAADPYIARQKIKDLDPDVLTLDVEMPRMDGISFLKNLMRLRPMPVVMVSSRTQRGAQATLDALALGAIDFVSKPDRNLAERLPAYRDEIVAKVKTAATARVRVGSAKARAIPDRQPAPRAPAIEAIAIGASTGGTEAIREILEALPPTLPPILVVQHIPFPFSRAFAHRLDSVSRVRVLEAAQGLRCEAGAAYVARGDRHLRIGHGRGRLQCELGDDERVNQHRPSVDVLFQSLRDTCGRAAIGVLLTGMGADGAAGLCGLRQRGAATLAQDEQSSVVWGMPREAVLLDGVDHVIPLGQIAETLVSMVSQADSSGETQPKSER